MEIDFLNRLDRLTQSAGTTEYADAQFSGCDARVNILGVVHIGVLDMLGQPVLQKIHDVDPSEAPGRSPVLHEAVRPFLERLVLGLVRGQAQDPYFAIKSSSSAKCLIV